MEFGAAIVASDEGYVRADGEFVKRAPWRPIHYLGSKLRALPALEDAISSVAPSGAPVCDLFAGSGTVSAWLAHHHPVIAVDIQEYSRVICEALLNPAHLSVGQVKADLADRLGGAKARGVMYAAAPLMEFEAQALQEASEGEPRNLAALLEAGSLATFRDSGDARGLAKAVDTSRKRLANLALHPVRSVAMRHFGGIYFSYRQAAELDVILDYAHAADKARRSMLIAAALSTASDLVNTVGKHFAQPLRPRNKDGTIKRGLYTQASRDRDKSTLDIFEEKLESYVTIEKSRYESRAVRADYRSFLHSSGHEYEVVYADPPYTRDHYSRFYHVLETLALRDDPQISTNTAHGKTELSRGVYRQDRHQSPFCIRSEAPGAFAELFALVASKGIPLVLSYSPYASEKNAHPRVMTMEAVTKLANIHFSKVDVASVGTFSHSRLNRSDLNKEISYEAEFLLACRP